MKKTLEMIGKNQKVVKGEELEFNGEVVMIGAMNEEEIVEMRKEGEKLLDTEVKYKGEMTKLRDIKSGKDLYNITEAIELEGNFTGMWFVWREYRIKERMGKLSKKAQDDIKKLLGE